jgi:hypothetical protein
MRLVLPLMSGQGKPACILKTALIIGMEREQKAILLDQITHLVVDHNTHRMVNRIRFLRPACT